jgi:hypothetical protein
MPTVPTQLIADLDFSVRVMNVLGVMKVSTLEQLVQLEERELLRSPNLGQTSLREIKATLSEMGFTLGMQLPPIAPTTIARRNEPNIDRTIVDCLRSQVSYYESLSRQGVGSADNHLGCIYLEGYAVVKDYRKARLYFLRAARRGNRLGYSNLAMLYRFGYGIRRSEVKASRWQAVYLRLQQST